MPTNRETSTIDRDQLETFRRETARCLVRLDKLVALGGNDLMIRNEITTIQAKCERFFREEICGPDEPEKGGINADR